MQHESVRMGVILPLHLLEGDECMALRRYLIQQHCLEAVIELPSLPSDALTEALNRVFANVLDHAFDAERCGTVRLRASAQPDGAVLIEVSDDGYGIEPAHLSKVFDPFFTTKSGMHGHVGLGLHVAYNHVVQRLKGGNQYSQRMEARYDSNDTD